MAFSIEYAYNFYIYNKYVYHVIPYIYIVVQYNYSMQSHHRDNIAGSFYSVVDWWTMLHVIEAYARVMPNFCLTEQ